LPIECLELGEISQELFSASGWDACTSPSIKYRLHQSKLGRTDLRTQQDGRRPPLDDIDAEILLLLRKYPFFTVRTIAESLGIPVSTICPHLVEKIGFKIFLHRWAPHTLTAELKQK
jgi:hypothetical protein